MRTQKKIALHARIFRIVSLAMILLLLITSVATFGYTYSTALRKTKESLQLGMIQNENNLNQLIQRLEEITFYPSNDRLLYELFQQPLPDTAAENKARENIGEYFIRTIHIPLLRTFSSFKYTFYLPSSLQAIALCKNWKKDSHLKPMDSATLQPWVQSTLQGKGRAFWYIDPESPDIISISREMRGFFEVYGTTTYGIIQIEIPKDEFFKHVLQSADSLHSSFAITITNGMTHSVTSETTLFLHVFSTLPEENKQLSDIHIDNSKYLFSRLRLQNQWELSSLTPFQIIVTDSLGTIPIFVLLLVSSVLIALVLSRYIATDIAKPIITLSDTMRHVDTQMSLYKSTGSNTSIEEIAELYLSFDTLIGEVDTLLKQTYAQGVEVKEAEIRALQAQINPHFLYNTLDSISWAIMDTGNTEVPTVISNLSDILRYGLRNYEELNTITEELQIARQYISIQEFCYSLQITFVEELTYAIDHPVLPKVTLQPIIENAIIHGILEHGKYSGTILLRVFEKNDTLVIQVENDSPANIEKMYATIHEKGHSDNHGLKNINSRLSIIYGKEYHLQFHETKNHGVIVEITIPLK